MKCLNCGSERMVNVDGKTSDMCVMTEYKVSFCVIGKVSSYMEADYTDFEAKN